MKTAIVYYSLEGNTELVANQLAAMLSADCIALHPTKQYPTGVVSKFIWGGKSAVFADEPELENYVFDSSQYDLVILGTPIWAGTFVPPLRTFLKQQKLANKNIALYACCAGGSTARCFQKLKEELPGCTVLGELTLVDPKRNEMQAKQEIEAFGNHIIQTLS